MAKHLFRPRGDGKRGQGTAYSFVLAVPKDLHGRITSKATGKPVRTIVEGLGTDSLREAESLAAARRVHWKQEFDRRRRNVPLTPAEIDAAAREAYTAALDSMATDALRRKRAASDEREAISATLEALLEDVHGPDHDDQTEIEDLTAEELEPLAGHHIRAVERRVGTPLAPDSETYRMLGQAFVRAEIAAMEGRLAALEGRKSEAPDTFIGAAGIDPRTLKPIVAKAGEHALNPVALFEAFVADAKIAPATVLSWQAVFKSLAAKFGDKRIREDDAREWARHQVTATRAAKTVATIWLGAARRVYGWAVEQKMVAGNPFKNVRVTVPRRIQNRESQAFTPQEIGTILSTALSIDPDKSAQKAAQRWCPWLAAYSGARMGELTQLRGQDIVKQDGSWCLKLTPEAGSIKTRQARTVPLHSHLVKQGFLDFVKARGNGPLFYNPVQDQKEIDVNKPRWSRANIARSELSVWIRKLGIADQELSPTHAFRHTFKQVAERSGISERMSDAITGHAPATAGRGYGKPTFADMAAALKKFPRYKVE